MTTSQRTIQTSMTTLAVRQPGVERSINTLGQQKLLEITDPIGTIAAKCGVTQPYVSQWRMGYNRPGPKVQARLHELYGIEPAAWRMRPLTEADVPPTIDDADASEPVDGVEQTAHPITPLPRHASALDHVDHMLAQLSERMADKTISARESSQLLDQWRKLMSMRMQAEQRAALLEDATVRNHPKWKRLKGLIIDALLPYPDAARAVESAIQRAIGDEQAEQNGD